MKISRRQFFRLTAGAAVLPTFSRRTRAQALPYPDKPVRIITHSAPGGSPDALLRIVGDRLSQMWGGSRSSCSIIRVRAAPWRASPGLE